MRSNPAWLGLAAHLIVAAAVLVACYRCRYFLASAAISGQLPSSLRGIGCAFAPVETHSAFWFCSGAGSLS